MSNNPFKTPIFYDDVDAIEGYDPTIYGLKKKIKQLDEAEPPKNLVVLDLYKATKTIQDDIFWDQREDLSQSRDAGYDGRTLQDAKRNQPEIVAQPERFTTCKVLKQKSHSITLEVSLNYTREPVADLGREARNYYRYQEKFITKCIKIDDMCALSLPTDCCVTLDSWNELYFGQPSKTAGIERKGKVSEKVALFRAIKQAHLVDHQKWIEIFLHYARDLNPESHRTSQNPKSDIAKMLYEDKDRLLKDAAAEILDRCNNSKVRVTSLRIEMFKVSSIVVSFTTGYPSANLSVDQMNFGNLGVEASEESRTRNLQPYNEASEASTLRRVVSRNDLFSESSLELKKLASFKFEADREFEELMRQRSCNYSCIDSDLDHLCFSLLEVVKNPSGGDGSF